MPTESLPGPPAGDAEPPARRLDRAFVACLLGGQAVQLLTLMVLHHHPQVEPWALVTVWVLAAAAYWIARERKDGRPGRAHALGGAGALAAYSLVTVMPRLGYGHLATAAAMLAVILAANVPAMLSSPPRTRRQWLGVAAVICTLAAVLGLAAWWDG